MPYQLKFVANKLDEALKDMASRHLTTYECARYDYGEVLDSFINRMDAAQKGLCRGTECQVKNSELELLIHSLKRIPSGDLQASLLCILEKRAKKRLFELNWYMLQEDYTNSGLLASMNVLCSYMKRNHPDEFAGTLFSRLGSPDENFLGNSLDLAIKEYDGIEEFLDRYNIMPLSAFGGRLCFEYYSKCDRPGFIADREMFYLFLDNYCDEEVYPAVANYLDSLDTVEYPDRINMLLLNRFSDPASSNCLWDNVSSALKQKFTQWMRLKEIEEHFSNDQRKYMLWCEFCSLITGVQQEKEHNLLFIDLGSYVAADTGEDKEDAFLYKKGIFNVLYEQFLAGKDNGLEWPGMPDGMISAREAILQEVFSDSYKINYEGVGILYIKEILKREKRRLKGLKAG